MTTAPDTAALGSTITVASPEAGQIAKARLIRPSAATHATDVEQRSVALDVTTNPNGTLDLAIPEQPTLVPPGYYMLFLVDGAGTPSKAHWVHVT
ncbi:galactose oxidase early set domain-containing protein [Pseudonocardia halophobica]|uniref:galactose oxidase early set domain-containing protein n=1 Tax=Pseudonocardia halophobica TaxID=29401 RepID=UPI0031CFF685